MGPANLYSADSRSDLENLIRPNTVLQVHSSKHSSKPSKRSWKSRECLRPMRLLSKQVNVGPFTEKGRNCVSAGRIQWDTFTRTVPGPHRLS